MQWDQNRSQADQGTLFSANLFRPVQVIANMFVHLNFNAQLSIFQLRDMIRVILYCNTRVSHSMTYPHDQEMSNTL